MHEIVSRGGVVRRGHLVMIAGVPNSGKSALAQSLAALTNRPGIYFSADQDAWQSTIKLIACLTGDDFHDVARVINTPEGKATYGPILTESNLQYCFDSNPSLEDIGLELDAYVDTWDEYPEIVIVDTLMNVSGSGEKQDDQFIMSELHGLARRTKAAVIVLVHQSRAGVKDSTKPQPVEKIINKLDALPDLIFMVAYDSEREVFSLCVGKTREGKADPEAERPVVMGADFARMQFGIPIKPTYSWGFGGEQ